MLSWQRNWLSAIIYVAKWLSVVFTWSWTTQQFFGCSKPSVFPILDPEPPPGMDASHSDQHANHASFVVLHRNWRSFSANWWRALLWKEAKKWNIGGHDLGVTQCVAYSLHKSSSKDSNVLMKTMYLCIANTFLFFFSTELHTGFALCG